MHALQDEAMILWKIDVSQRGEMRENIRPQMTDTGVAQIYRSETFGDDVWQWYDGIAVQIDLPQILQS